MNFKLNAIAALLALASFGASATMTGVAANAANEDSSLVLELLDKTGTAISATIDLGFTYSQFIGGGTYNAAGTSIQWNLNNNTRTVNGVTETAGFAWSDAFSTFQGTAQVAETTWAVMGADVFGTGGSLTLGTATRGILVTGTPTTANMTAFTNTGNAGTLIGAMTGHLAAISNSGNHLTVDNGGGATTATTTVAYNANSNVYGTNGNFNGKINWSIFSANGATTNLQTISSTTVITQLGSQVDSVDAALAAIDDPITFTFDANTGILSYQVAAVPEASTYAMMAAGLLVVGALARRRRAA